jgi:DNA-3-methyladenine glycosylase II
MIRIPIKDKARFNFDECLLFLNRSPRECMHRVEDGHLYKLFADGDTPVLLDISYKNGEIQVQPKGPVNETAVKDYITRWLHLDGNMESFYRFAADDHILGPLVSEYKGLRLIGIPDLFESLTWTITGQQINLAFAYTLKQRLVQAFGYETEIDGYPYYLYPPPEVLAVVPPEKLLEMQFSKGKTAYILHVAQQMAEGNLTAEQLLQMDYSAALEKLVSLKGIGNWSANYVLMKYARFPQALPLEDAGLHNALKNRMRLAVKPPIPDVKEYTAHWKNNAAYATFYLWRSLYTK